MESFYTPYSHDDEEPNQIKGDECEKEVKNFFLSSFYTLLPYSMRFFSTFLCISELNFIFEHDLHAVRVGLCLYCHVVK